MNYQQNTHTLLVSVILIIALFPIGSIAATLHAIIAGDTNDPSIGESVQIDVDNLQILVENIHKYTGMALKTQVFQHNDLTKAAVEKAVADLLVESEDAVIFYFSGHGYRHSNTRSPWPYLFMPPCDALDFSKVIIELKAKKPRFLLAISDSCNSVLDNYPSPLVGFIGEDEELVAKSYQKLFLDYQGHIASSAAGPGEISYGFSVPKIGGLFTHTFLTALENSLSSSEPNWETIMKQSGSPINVRQIWPKAPTDYQCPQYQLQLRDQAKPPIIVNTLDSQPSECPQWTQPVSSCTPQVP